MKTGEGKGKEEKEMHSIDTHGNRVVNKILTRVCVLNHVIITFFCPLSSSSF